MSGSSGGQYGDCKELAHLSALAQGSPGSSFQANAGDHGSLGATDTVVALFYISANILTKLLTMENENLQE